MRTSKYLLYTMKNVPYNNPDTSYRLMLQSGLIRKSDTGLYTWLPNGVRVLKKIKKIIRYEMNKIGAMEIFFPILQSKNLWEKSNRLQQYGKELIRLYDRNNHLFVLSPTYEEMATNFIKQEIQSYKKLPIILYQIQTKFRDEIRPRLGIMRAREFIMKDAYSFHENFDSLNKTYQIIYNTYITIFNKMHLTFYPVQADSGIMGGKYSHEFQAPAKYGEDKIIIDIYNKKKYCKNIKINTLKIKYKDKIKQYIDINDIYQKNKKELQKIFYEMKNDVVKIFILKQKINNVYKFIGFIIRGYDTLNIKKIIQLNIFNQKKNTLTFANSIEIKKIICNHNMIYFNIPIIIDTNIILLKNIIPIVIINNIFFTKQMLNTDFKKIKISNIIDNDKKKIKNSIEIGHIFQIGQKYSKINNTTIKDKQGNQQFIYMGCYGIGVTRLISAIIEQHHDNQGIIWPHNLAPFQLLIIPINFYTCQKIQKISNDLYNQFHNQNIEVLIDDRNERIGTIFHDANLLGIPNIIIINNNTLYNHTIEYQERKNIKKKKIIHIKDIINFIVKKIKISH